MPKLLHIADIHLDSPFSLLDAEKASVRRNELRGIFSSVMLFVKSAGIDAVLIAGDLFDTGFVTAETAALIKNAFASCPDCKFIISPGNHDPYTETSVYRSVSFSPNVFIFSSETVQKFSFDDLNMDVYGFAFCDNELRRSPVAEFRVEDPERINILLAHCDIASPLSKYAPVTKNDLSSCGVDYAALGHIHNSDGVLKAGNTHYAYSGVLDGRSYDETGHKGGILLDIQKDHGVLHFQYNGIRFSKRHYEKDTLNISGAGSMAEIEEKIRTYITAKKYDMDTLLRLTLSGAVSSDFKLNRAVLEQTDFGLFSFELEDQTLPLYNKEHLINDPTIRGEFFRTILPHLENGSSQEREIYAEALRIGLSALSGEDFADFH